ncbi:MAG: ATPase [Marinilabiliales bacterium]|nr:MAG: ATPase [Marinilabiliales bacterium]
MIDPNQLKIIINDQREFQWRDSFVERNIPDHIVSNDEIVVISGVRRCGKSTLIQQIRSKNHESDYFINFDDDRLIQFDINDFQQLLIIFKSLFGEQKTFYFDEIQNIKGWERFVRRLFDTGNKVFITGSNASMLSRELGTHLTGRYLSYEIFPFSLKEYLLYHKIPLINIDLFDTKTTAEVRTYFEKYITDGGFPAFLKQKNKQYLKSLYESILYRDIMVRNMITAEKEILELVFYLASNTSKLISYTALSKIIGVSNPTTIKNYLSYMENTYLLFLVSKFDFSVKKQVRNPKKIYFIDNALTNTLGFSFSANKGRYLENLVFIELLRRGSEVFYYQNGGECDFIVRDGARITMAIQVTQSLTDPKTKEREISGLEVAINDLEPLEALILTDYEEGEIQLNNTSVRIIPVWKWCLEND